MINQIRSFSPSPSPEGATADFLREVLSGLSQPDKRLPCKYFYDEAGGQLFERICALDEYYPTRCELAILERHANSMAERIGAGAALIEYGSGSSRKTRLLLDQLIRPAAYVPVDINGQQLLHTARALGQAYPNLLVRPVEADFARPFALPPLRRKATRRVVYFSGSTIGNFEPDAARDLFASIAALVGPGGGLLIGVDLKKDPAILRAAYNDRLGVTAAFNLNLLTRINRELNADFAVDRFHHYAFYNPTLNRIEMHLVSQMSQIVRVEESSFPLVEGESICTEYSYKFNLEDCRSLAHDAGLRLRETWLDEREWFSVQYWTVEDA
jgi:dimethylhistidine N-methyltransferase